MWFFFFLGERAFFFFLRYAFCKLHFAVTDRIRLVLILGCRRSECLNSLSTNVPQLPHTSQTDSLPSEELRRRRQAYFEK